MDRGLARLCWRCPGLRLHTNSNVLNDRRVSSTDNVLVGQYFRSNSDKQGREKSCRIIETLAKPNPKPAGAGDPVKKYQAGKCNNCIVSTYSSYDSKACSDSEAGLFGRETGISLCVSCEEGRDASKTCSIFFAQ